METVRAVLLVAAGSSVSSAEADAILLEYPAIEDGAFADGALDAAAAQVARLAGGETPLYLALPPIASGLARDYLLATLREGVYGVSVGDPTSIEQVRYAESLIEEAERRAELRLGLTAMAVWFSTARAISIAPETLAKLRSGAGRVTWVGFDAEVLAAALGIERASATLDAARALLVLAAAAEGLPLVERIAAGDQGAADAARTAGVRGVATTEHDALARLRAEFPGAEADSD